LTAERKARMLVLLSQWVQFCQTKMHVRTEWVGHWVSPELEAYVLAKMLRDYLTERFDLGEIWFDTGMKSNPSDVENGYAKCKKWEEQKAFHSRWMADSISD
jgi:hypothetical protein